MANGGKDKLDRLLQAWAAHTAPEKDRVNALALKVSAAVGDVRFADLEEGLGDRSVLTYGGRLAWFSVGAAVAVLVMAFWSLCTSRPGEQYGGQPGGTDGQPQVAEASASLTGQQLAAAATLFAEMQHVFSRELAWVAEADGTVCVGLDSHFPSEPGPAPAIVVRIVLVSRKEGELTWKVLRKMDVVTRSEQRVELSPEELSGAKVVLWAYPLAEGLILLDSSLVLDAPIRASSSTSEVLRAGSPIQLLSVQTGDAEYRVFQTAEVMAGKAG